MEERSEAPPRDAIDCREFGATFADAEPRGLKFEGSLATGNLGNGKPIGPVRRFVVDIMLLLLALFENPCGSESVAPNCWLPKCKVPSEVRMDARGILRGANSL